MGPQRAIERERRWAVPAAVAAVLSFALYLVSYVIERTAGIYAGASDAHQLRSLNDHAGTIVFASAVRAIAFLLLPIPFIYLFRAAQARNPRVQAAMIGFVLIGPILFSAQTVAQALGARNAASDFVKLAKEPHKPYPAFQHQLNTDSGSLDKVTIYTALDKPALEVQQTSGSFYKVKHFGKSNPQKVVTDLPAKLDAASPSVDHETQTDAEAQIGDARASDTTSGDSTLQLAQGLLFPAVLGLVVMMIYVPLQAQRVGLLTRFFGSFGMALGASIILILPVALLGVLVWTGFLGLLFVGRIPKGRPPAWEAGEAIPWQRPGEGSEEGADSGETVINGEASEVEGEDESSSRSIDAPAAGKRKRKQRR
ncbi:MAG: hypothetical protein ACRDK1_07025 [Solirubrobacterales bacterium]